MTTDTIDNFIETEIQSGRYKNREELVTEALRQMIERENELDFLADHMSKAAEEVRYGCGQPLTFETIQEYVRRERAENTNATS